MTQKNEFLDLLNKALDFLFPIRRTGPPPIPGSRSRQALRFFSKIAPFLSLGLIGFIVWAYGFLGWFIGGVCLLYLAYILFTAYVTKNVGRDPAILLASTLVQPLVILTILLGLGTYLWQEAQPQWVKRQQAYLRAHPGKPMPMDGHFGLTFGHTTFEETLDVLNQHEAKYRIKARNRASNIPTIEIQSFDLAKEEVGKFTLMTLNFDHLGRVFEAKFEIPRKGLSFGGAPKYVELMHKRFLKQYPWMHVDASDSEDFAKAYSYYSPSGLEVRLSASIGGAIRYTFLPRMESTKQMQQQDRQYGDINRLSWVKNSPVAVEALAEFHQNPDYPDWKWAYDAYRRKYPNTEVPKDTLFGITFGETTRAEVVQLLKDEKAEFNMGIVGDTISIPELRVYSFNPARDYLGDFRSMTITFDDEDRVYSIECSFSRTVDQATALTTNEHTPRYGDMRDNLIYFHSVFKEKYEHFVPHKHEKSALSYINFFYRSPSGLEIHTQANAMGWCVLKMENKPKEANTIAMRDANRSA